MTAAQAFFTILFDGAYPPDWRERLDRTLPMTPFSWNPELLIWGRRDTTSLEIWLDKGVPAYGQLRLDLQTPDLDFLTNVLAFAKAYSLSMEDERGAWLPTTVDGIRAGLQQSAAWKLLPNPHDLLGRLGTTHA